ncbi:MAG: chromosomal replication initiator protein DnaA [Desulfobacterales bacterium]|nr:chromosomal replication initiator protein DnaA [Desulfobacterales bacterium]
MESFWTQVKSQVKASLPEHSYRMWIDPVEFLGSEENCIRLSSPNSFCARRLKENYLPVFKKEFDRLGKAVDIEFTVGGKKAGIAKGAVGMTMKAARPAEKAVPAPRPRRRSESGSFAATLFTPSSPKKVEQQTLPGFDMRFNGGRMLKKGYTFDDFVVGDNSNFAYSASLSLAQGRIRGNNVLYLLSKTGLGKSHLSQAVGHHILANEANERVYYVTAEDFTNEMIFALKNNSIQKFKDKYRTQCDVLILEDIHFLSGKEATQKELAQTLDYLLDADRKIIFSGCDLPDEIPKINDQLKSRLGMGLVTEIDKPDFSTRVKILQKKALGLGCAIPMSVTEYIAQELTDDVRQLESGLYGVTAKGQLMNQNIDIDLAQSVLVNMVKARKQITIDLIKKLVCNEFSVTESEIISKSRKQRIVKPRQVAMFLARRYTKQPIKKIGASFKRYHATAIYSVNAIERQLKQRGQMYEQINYLSNKLENGKF